jgi:hypothetical protein
MVRRGRTDLGHHDGGATHRAGAFAKHKERVQMKNLTVLTGRREPSAAPAADGEVELTIEAAALADVRAAIIELYRDELDAVRDEYERIAADVTRPLDAAGVARLDAAHRRLAAITARFDPVLQATDDTTITAHPEALAALLLETVQVTARRLEQLTERRPVPMRAVLELAGQMRWTAGQAIRTDPCLGRTGA